MREHILCVDDEEGILAALRQQLSARFGDECDIAVAKNAREALELIDELQQDGEQIAVVIADQIMPGMKGVELLEVVHRRSPQTMKILLTGQAGLDAVVYAINRAGLNQYIPKPWDEPDLRLTIQNLLSRFRLERERAELLQRAADEERRAGDAELVARGEGRRADARAGDAERAARPAGDHRRPDRPLQPPPLPRAAVARDGAQQPHRAAAVGADDRRRSLQGLQRSPRPPGRRQRPARRVQVLQHGRRANDVVARYGGEEFAIILLDVGKSAAKEVAERICAQVAEFPFEFGSTQPSGKLTISLGVASFPDDGAEPALVLAAADRALFAAKNAGRNRVRVAGT